MSDVRSATGRVMKPDAPTPDFVPPHGRALTRAGLISTAIALAFLVGLTFFGLVTFDRVSAPGATVDASVQQGLGADDCSSSIDTIRHGDLEFRYTRPDDREAIAGLRF